jgi:hypothetical protein
LTEAVYADKIVTSSTVKPSEVNIVPRKTIVYKTLIDPSVVRIEGEKLKSTLFKEKTFWQKQSEKIDFISVEKYYDPYITINGQYTIDYYRKATYKWKVSKEVKEVVLSGKTFKLNQIAKEQEIEVDAEERLFKESSAFLVFDKDGNQMELSNVQFGQSESGAEELFKTFKMSEIPQNRDLDLLRGEIAQRPEEVNRVISEVLKVDERSVIYIPMYKLTYRHVQSGKEASIEFNGITGQVIKRSKAGAGCIKSILLG